jgi:hypothetical protein
VYKPYRGQVLVSNQLVDLRKAPTEALHRIVWLDEYLRLVHEEVDAELQRCYFEARLQGQLDAALAIAPHGRKAFLRMTRNENEARGRAVRWGDGHRA